MKYKDYSDIYEFIGDIKDATKNIEGIMQNNADDAPLKTWTSLLGYTRLDSAKYKWSNRARQGNMGTFDLQVQYYIDLCAPVNTKIDEVEFSHEEAYNEMLRTFDEARAEYERDNEETRLINLARIEDNKRYLLTIGEEFKDRGIRAYNFDKIMKLLRDVFPLHDTAWADIQSRIKLKRQDLVKHGTDALMRYRHRMEQEKKARARDERAAMLAIFHFKYMPDKDPTLSMENPTTMFLGMVRAFTETNDVDAGTVLGDVAKIICHQEDIALQDVVDIFDEFFTDKEVDECCETFRTTHAETYAIDPKHVADLHKFLEYFASDVFTA